MMGIILALILIITAVFCIGLQIMSKGKSERQLVYVNGVISMLIGIVNLVIAAMALLHPTGEIYIENSGDNSVVAGTVYYENEKELSIEQKVRYAKKLYDANQMEKVMELYSDETLEDNPVVNSNLGYLYAKGIYVDKSECIAEGYFYKAIELGYDEAHLQLLAMYLENNLEIASKYLLEKQDIKCVKELIAEKNLDMEQDYIELAEQLKKVFFVEVDRGSIVSSELMTSNEYKIYNLTGTQAYLSRDGERYNTVRMYKMHEWIIADEQRLEYYFQ